jgi:serine/threonine-protein kinase HSL1 (negative regulator of Swe1 kinase)
MADDNPSRLKRRRTSEQDDPKMIGLWKIGRMIGKGSQGMDAHKRYTRSY